MKHFFQTHLYSKKGGGRDRIKPDKFYQIYVDSLGLIVDKCLTGKYNFAPYTESLINKGRNKKPRVISIPTVRDRWVLGVLAKYLQSVFPECVCHDLPNGFISNIQSFIERNKNGNVFFLQTDIESFYDTINLNLLLSKVNDKVKDSAIMLLIENALRNPTVSLTEHTFPVRNDLGVPQGLAISNILAHIYMHSLDEELSKESFTYFRYVDDILCFSTTKRHLNARYIKSLLNKHKLGLKLAQKKTLAGNLRDCRIDYLGYSIGLETISIRQKNIDRFLNRIASKCVQFNDQYLNTYKRPRYLMAENCVFITMFCHEMNLLICGAKSESKKYGWLPYFMQMNDKELLFRFDKILNKMLTRIECFRQERPREIKKFVYAYHRLKYRNGEGALFDYDKIIGVDEKRLYLKRFGQLSDSINYDDKQIEDIFERYKNRNLLALEQDMGAY